ncbi:hypothetical protein PGTUg99_003710 [Puccinia graminis f. sp. tritici]|uniref:Uncharacterized protein n=1 Tax=Puccinia graminis f. sp. tritici TaxID=56615 RepID=A0A5B0LMC5_PUCGR|nr:hypothetical protein PGTUg99_003710 [Puccinia graminis f. sp. tritici]
MSADRIQTRYRRPKETASRQKLRLNSTGLSLLGSCPQALPPTKPLPLPSLSHPPPLFLACQRLELSVLDFL